MSLPIQPVSFSPEPIAPIASQTAVLPTQQLDAISDKFEGFLLNSISGINDQSLKADQAIVDWRMGKIENLHEVSMALARADLSLRLLIQVRNKVVDAYQEVMRMQI